MKNTTPLSFALMSALLFTACQGTTSDDAVMDDTMMEDDSMVEDDAMMDDEDTMMEDDNGFSREDADVDEDASTVTFVGGSNIIDHDGSFGEFDVEIDLDNENPSDFTQASIMVTLESDSIESDAPGLTGHLKKEDFFDVETYPTITFESTDIEKTGDNTYDITGDLTVKGTTETVVMQGVLTNEMLTVSYDMPRKTFNVGNDSYGDKLLDEEVPVTATVVFES